MSADCRKGCYGLRTTDYGLNDWRILIDQPRAAAEHMALDEALAQEALPTVRWFTWDPAAVSLGWKQPLPGWLNPTHWAAAGLEWVERPTGGGIAFHGSDLSLAVVVPRALEIPLDAVMSAICESTARLCALFGIDATCRLEAMNAERITYCLTQESPFSVCVDGLKVAGFALRRYPKSWLIQGSLLIRPLLHALAHALPPDVMDRLSARAISLSEATAMSVSEQSAAQRWDEHWASWFDADSRGYQGGFPRIDQRRSASALRSARISVT